MDKELKQKLALFVIGLLALTKFIVMPEIESQNQLLNKIAQVKKTNNKYEYLLSKKQQYADFEKESKAIELSLSQNLITFNDQPEFLLQSQKQIESAIKESGLKVKRFIWFNGNDEAIIGNLYKKRIRLVLTGKTKNYIALHTWLKENEPKFRLDTMSLNHGKNTTISLGQSDGTFIISAFYFKDVV